MLSKKPFIVLLLLSAFSCEDRGSGILDEDMLSNSISVQEVHALAMQMNYDIQLENGNVDFRPSEQFASPSSLSYASPQTTNYSRLGQINFKVRSFGLSEGSLEIDFPEFGFDYTARFQYILVTTAGELEKAYPEEIEVEPDERDLVFAIAIGSRSYDIEDFFNQDLFRVTDYLYMVGNPTTGLGSGAVFIEEEEDRPGGLPPFFYLDGPFQSSDAFFASEGEAQLVVYGSQAFQRLLGEYSLVLNE